MSTAEYQRQWRKNNLESARAIERRYYHNHRNSILEKKSKQYERADWEIVQLKRRIHKLHALARQHGAGGTFTLDEWLSLCEYYGNKCLACGEQEPLTVDHITPLSEGGPNDMTNIQPLCKHCNCSKNSKTIDYRPTVPEWIKLQP